MDSKHFFEPVRLFLFYILILELIPIDASNRKQKNSVQASKVAIFAVLTSLVLFLFVFLPLQLISNLLEDLDVMLEYGKDRVAVVTAHD